MRYQILYQPAFSLAVVALERGEQIMAESGAMVSMSPTIKLQAAMSGGGLLGAFKSAVGGESLFRTTFTAEDGPGEITLRRGAGRHHGGRVDGLAILCPAGQLHGG